LIYLGPLLRGWERLKWRCKTMPRHDNIRPDPVEQRARIDWRERAFLLRYWDESGAEKEILLGGLMDFLLPQKYFVVADTGWSKWDLKISRGLWSRALVTVVAENHGGMKQLLRVRCAMRTSSLGRVLLRGYAAVAAGSLILGEPLAAVIIFAIALVNLGVIGWRLVTFGQLMHRIVETVARQAKLVPAAPIRGAVLPIGRSRTA
jgi:O-antigen biosynthesis protein